MVNKEEYYLRLYAVYNQNTIKKPWNLERTNDVIDILKNYQTKISENNKRALLPKEKYYGGKYDLLEISDGVLKVILKPKYVDDDFIYVTPIEEFFDKIDEQHKATSHGGRDKMLRNLKKECTIPRLAVQVYAELCTICNLKKKQKCAGLMVKVKKSKKIHSDVETGKYLNVTIPKFEGDPLGNLEEQPEETPSDNSEDGIRRNDDETQEIATNKTVPQFLTIRTPSELCDNSNRSITSQTPKRRIAAVPNTSYTEDEYDIVGANVAFKLRRMDVDQRQFAEQIINTALFYGSQNKLTENAHILLNSYNNFNNSY